MYDKIHYKLKKKKNRKKKNFKDFIARNHIHDQQAVLRTDLFMTIHPFIILKRPTGYKVSFIQQPRVLPSSQAQGRHRV